MKYVKKYLVWEMLLLTILSIFLWNRSDLQIYNMISASMEPKIKIGSLIISKKENFDKLEIGDIITYKMTNSNIYVTHEVIEVDTANRRVFTKGIANRDSDNDAIQEMQYQGTMKVCIAYLGYLGILYHYPIVKVIIWVSIALLMYLLFKKDIKKLRKRQ